MEDNSEEKMTFFQILVSALLILLLSLLLTNGLIFALNTANDIKTSEVNQVTLVNGSNIICYSVRGLASNVYTDCTDNREHFVGISDSIGARRLDK